MKYNSVDLIVYKYIQPFRILVSSSHSFAEIKNQHRISRALGQPPSRGWTSWGNPASDKEETWSRLIAAALITKQECGKPNQVSVWATVIPSANHERRSEWRHMPRKNTDNFSNATYILLKHKRNVIVQYYNISSTANFDFAGSINDL